MANGHDDIEDDIFEDHINEIDVRETPRWEMSEEDEDGTISDTKLLTKRINKPEKQQTKTDIVTSGTSWNNNDDKDSLKDYTVSYCEQEAKYRERTNEAIFERASQPNPYDDVDSVKNYGESSSHGVSRIPSNEKQCLSTLLTPEYELDDGIIDVKRENAKGNSFMADDAIIASKMKMDVRIGANAWHGGLDMDITRDYAKEGSLENSSRPSSEDISLTPPWLETDKESTCKVVETREQGGIDDCERMNTIPATTNNVLSNKSTTTPVIKTDESQYHVNNSQTESPSQLSCAPPRTGGNTCNINNVPGSTCESLSVARFPPPQPNQLRPTGNPVVPIQPPQVRQYGSEMFRNQYPSPHLSYLPKDPYFPTTGAPPYPNVHTYPPIHYPLPTGAEYQQQQKLQKFNKMSTFVNTQYDVRSQPIRKSFPINSAANIGYYATRRPLLNRYQPPYYGPQPGSWQPYSSMNQAVNPKINSDDFAPDEVIDYGAQSDISERVRPDLENLRRNRHQTERAASHNYRNNSDLPRNIPEVHRDATDSSNIRNMSAHPRAIPEIQIGKSYYTDIPDDITMVSDSDVSPVMSTRSGSQSSLAVYCNTPHHDGLETSSVMSFTSGASTHQDLDSKIDQVRNLLAVIDIRDAKETALTLFSVSNSKDNCQAMRLSGCLQLLIQLQHKCRTREPRVAHEVRVRSSQAIRNIVSAGVDDKRGKREIRVLQLLEIVRNYCTEVLYLRHSPSSSKMNSLNNALAAIMKLSFEEEHRATIEDLGGVEAIGELLELSHVTKDGETLTLNTNIRKYASMTLTNMTFEKTRSKALLGNSSGIVRALLKNLAVLDDEDLIQVSASVLRNLSCKSDERSKVVLQECNAGPELISAAQKVSAESTLRTILYAVWNLSAHSTENKVQLCESTKSLAFLVEMLAYKSRSNSLSVIESSGGILRNLSSQIAIKSEYRHILRENDCFKFLLGNLRSPSLRVVSNACGILWNLSARCEIDQQLLLKMNAIVLLKPLITSKNKSISKGAGAAIKNLQNYKTAHPGRYSPPEARKQNGILRHENGSPSASRSKGKSRDAHSLNSFTGSADDMSRENGKNSRLKENVEIESGGARTKGVRWCDDKRSQRKLSNDVRKRSDSSLDEHKDGLNDVTDGIGYLHMGEKSREYSSPRTKKKSNNKNKKNHPNGDNISSENFHQSQNSGNNRRYTSEISTKQSTRHERGKDTRKVMLSTRDLDDNHVTRSGDDSCRNSPISNRRNVRTGKHSEENDRDVTDRKKERCQCSDELDIWVKRDKICGHCHKRRISHSSDSTSGSRRSSSESLSSSTRYILRKEPHANGVGYVTTI